MKTASPSQAPSARAPAAPSARPRVWLPAVGWYLLLAVLIWAAVFAALATRPPLALDQATGLYKPEAGGFRWSGSRISLPLEPRGQPLQLTLRLGAETWPGRAPTTPVQIDTGHGSLLIEAAPRPRDYRLLLPPTLTALRLETPVARPPGGEWRWLGLQLYSAQAVAPGLPWRAAWLASLAGLAGLLVALGLAWAAPRGFAPLLLIGLLGLGVRLVALADAPPGLHRDEAVSLVDAWNLAQTGRDHLGHPLPLAAFEAYGDWISPLLAYLEVPLVALLGPQPLAARLVTALAGALAVPVIYALARTLGLPLVGGLAAALVAALSPWQIFLSRVAIPPGLVPLCWSLCLLAAVRLLHAGGRQNALALALAAGLALYAYPTMKLAVPLLLLLTAVLLIWQARATGQARFAAYWPALLLLLLLWAPFIADLLLNPNSGARFAQIGLRATSAGEWLAKWWAGYSVYIGADFWYITGDTRKIVRGVPGHGVALWPEAMLALAGLAALLLQVVRKRAAPVSQDSSRQSSQPSTLNPQPSTRLAWLFIFCMLLLAPLPASLTQPNPNVFRASPLAPLYALVCGLGAAVLWQLATRLPLRALALRFATAGLLALALLGQFSAWYADLLLRYPVYVAPTWFFADNVLPAMAQVVEYAPGYDQIWLDTDSIGRPYIYLLAARPMPARQAQQQIEVQRRPPGVNEITRIGPYRFGDLARLQVPVDLPAVAVITERYGDFGYLLQTWQHHNQRILVVRGMGNLPVEIDSAE